MRICKKEFLVILLCSVIFPAIIFSAITPKRPVFPEIADTTAPVVTEMIPDDYRIRLLNDDGSVSQMSLEEYVLCVVLKEMPADFETEALKAQAVATRTYTLFRSLKQDKHKNADVCTDPSCCQAFSTVESYLSNVGNYENVTRIRSAVDNTKGLVITYGGTLIESTYFSSSGGMTESAVAVWGADVPYLQATESPGEESAAHYTESVFFSETELKKALGVSPTSVNGDFIRDIRYTEGNGIDTIIIGGKQFTGVELRTLLNLRSTAIAITPTGNGITITTKGFGHRVGMSQYGANAMAQNGSTYTEILTHYYTGVSLCDLKHAGITEFQ